MIRKPKELLKITAFRPNIRNTLIKGKQEQVDDRHKRYLDFGIITYNIT